MRLLGGWEVSDAAERPPIQPGDAGDTCGAEPSEGPAFGEQADGTAAAAAAAAAAEEEEEDDDDDDDEEDDGTFRAGVAGCMAATAAGTAAVVRSIRPAPSGWSTSKSARSYPTSTARESGSEPLAAAMTSAKQQRDTMSSLRSHHSSEAASQGAAGLD